MDRTERILKAKNAVETLLSENCPEQLKEDVLFAVSLLDEKYSDEVKRLKDANKPQAERTRWTAEEETELKEEYGKGKTIEQLAKRHERSMSGIVSRLSLLGLINDNAESGGKRWKKTEEDLLTAEYGEGRTVEEMSLVHKRTLSGIISRLTKLGLIKE